MQLFYCSWTSNVVNTCKTSDRFSIQLLKISATCRLKILENRQLTEKVFFQVTSPKNKTQIQWLKTTWDFMQHNLATLKQSENITIIQIFYTE